MDTSNYFIIFDLSNFIYGITIYKINKKNNQTEFKKIEKFQEDESVIEALERILNIYNVNEFIFRPCKIDTKYLEKNLTCKGFKKYTKE